MYSGNGLIGVDGRIDEEKRNLLERWLKELALRIDSLDTDADSTLNLELPSGYTYLLQLVGHDLVDSVPSAALDHSSGDDSPPPRLIIKNARYQPLALDTVYGAGPDEASFAYRPSNSPDATSPRTELFLKVLPRFAHPTSYCAFHDIRRIKSDPLLADPRNDAHSILAQLTALFHLLHNQIIALIGAPPSHSRNEGLYRRYLCARSVVTLIYRNIIRKDVIGRILHPFVFAKYKVMRDASQLLDREVGTPLEFSHGAFRFGHALVRTEYSINSEERRGIHLAISRTTHRELGEGPLSSDWLVDWVRFFSPESTPSGASFNFAHKIGPQYSVRLGMFDVAPPRDPVQGQGLAYRDLRSAAYAGLWSAPALCQELHNRGFEDIPVYTDWKKRIAQWLGPEFDNAAMEAISNDPPLPFFVLFEAANSAASGETLGHRLGLVGSILVAEAIYGALLKHPLPFEGSTSLTQCIHDCCGALLGNAHVLSQRPGQTGQRDLEIESMPQLLRFMADNGAFAPGASPVLDA